MQGIVKPYTVIGDQKWSDYVLSADVHIAGGDVELGGDSATRTSCRTAGSWRRTATGSSNWKRLYGV